MVGIRIKLGVIILSVVIIVLTMVTYVPATSGEPLGAAMEATGAHLQDYSISAWVKLPGERISDSHLQNIVEEAMEQLGIGVDMYQIVHQQKGEYRTVRAESINREFHVVAIAQVIPNGQNSGGAPEAYLVVNVESTVEVNPSISQMQKKVSRIMQKKGDSPRISTCLMGWLDGKLRDGEGQHILQSAFTIIDGTIIDKLEHEHFVSCTGFSSAIEDWVQVGDKRVNINMAIRYSQYDNRTYVMIGSPIITREY